MLPNSGVRSATGGIFGSILLAGIGRLWGAWNERGADKGVVDDHDVEHAGNDGVDPAQVPGLVAGVLNYVGLFSGWRPHELAEQRIGCVGVLFLIVEPVL